VHEYHGQGLGYRMMQELLSFAREKGYTRMRLETDRDAQSRAFEFYKRLGFYEIPRYSDNKDDIAMEIIL
jgi:ribosomal protein S18 acetylase RimI-like enzyme